MQKQNFNFGWEFAHENDLDAYNRYGLYEVKRGLGAPEHYHHYNNWKKIDLPHDWAVGLPKDMRSNTYCASRPTSHYNRFTTEGDVMMDKVYAVGWYRKEFAYDPDWKGKRVFLEFEGIYRDSAFWVNGMYMDNHCSGYTSFLLELTDALYEDDINSIAVRVDVEQVEGYWYEGAGIYRNVNLLVAEPVYCKPYETIVKADISGKVNASAILVNDSENDLVLPVRWTVLDGDKAVAEVIKETTLPAYSETPVSAELQVENPKLWDLENPNLYTLKIEALEASTETFGFRKLTFDGESGFFLNDKPVKIMGACVQQDFAGVGIGLSENLIRYKLQKLKDMGMNAYRVHYAHSPDLLKACDEMGILVMAETRMFGPFPEAIRQFEDMVKRDRNHPSIFIWSIGNEETFLQHSEMGKNMGKKVCRIIQKLDDTRPFTYAGNSGWAFVGINAGVSVKGINYIRNMDVDGYHREHPQDPIIGTEEGCYVSDRVSLCTDLSAQTLLSNGTVTMGWASSPKGWVKYVMERPWFMGAFLWSGFDFHGEAHPFVNSAFSTYMGSIDLCGIEKPAFYYYQAWLKNEPLLKITPHWNGKVGKLATVTVFTNCQHISLKLNGKLIGEMDVQRFDAPEFTLAFAPGILEAEGIRDGVKYYDCVKTADAPAKLTQSLILPCEKKEDIGIIEVQAVDSDGNLCADCGKKVDLSFAGGDIVGVGNGNPNDWDYEQKPAEYEYHYLLAFETDFGHYAIPPKEGNNYMYSPYLVDHKFSETYEPKKAGFEDDLRRLIGTVPAMRMHEKRELTFVNRCDLSRDFTYFEIERLYGSAKVYLDGVELGNTSVPDGRCASTENRPFRFYCDVKAGSHEVKIVTTLPGNQLGAVAGYVRFGTEVNKNNWTVNLYGGKARVMVKYTDNYILETKFHP